MSKKQIPNTLLLEIGFTNTVMINRIICILDIDTNPVKKMVSDNKAIGMLIDLTKDKKTKSAILMDNDYIILSPLNPETLNDRIARKGALIHGFKMEEPTNSKDI